MIDHLRKGAPERLENLSAVPFESLPLSLHKQKSALIGYFFVWRRERDSSGGTGTVPPPARGTKKTSTGRFFASLRSAVPFESLPLSLHKQKKHPFGYFFVWRRERDSNPCYGSP